MRYVTFITSDGNVITQRHNSFFDGTWRYPESNHIIHKEGKIVGKFKEFNSENINILKKSENNCK